MKILHLSTWDGGGAGRAALRLHRGLEKRGVNSTLLVRDKRAQDQSIVEFDKRLFIDPLAIQYVKERDYELPRDQGIKGFDVLSHEVSEYRVEQHPLIKEADLIHLHWIMRWINFPTFFRSIKGKPIVWTLHDINPLTGGCHYSSGCTRYELGCGRCLQLGSENDRDLSTKIYNEKSDAYLDNNFTIVTPSLWLKNVVENSKLFREKRSVLIPYGIPLDLYIPKNKVESRSILGLPLDSFIILFQSEYDTPRKGFDLFIDTLRKLSYSDHKVKPHVLLMGRVDPSKISELGIEYKYMGYVSEEDLLINCYSAADLTIFPSREDNLPNGIIESISCGAPVLAFNVGGISEIVSDNQNGFLVPPFNTTYMSLILADLIDNPEKLCKVSSFCHSSISGRFSETEQADKMANLYNMLLSQL